MNNMPDEYDILMKDVFIVDGTGSPRYKGYVAVKGERIAVVEKGSVKADAKTVINGKGLTVTPGFIDVHNHADLSITYYPRAESFVRQGITSFVGGHCGTSPGPYGEYVGQPWMLGDIYTDVADKMYYKDWLVPRDLLNSRHKELYGWEIDWNTLGEFFKQLEKKGFSPNYAPLVGHGEIRSLVMGLDFQRTATRKEISEMMEHAEKAMEDRCIGISVGRDYDPGIYAGFDELLACAKVATKYHGVYTSHCLRTGHRKARNPGTPAPVATEGVLEAIDIGRKAKISVEISHLGNLFTIRPGGNQIVTRAALQATLKVIDDARAEGLDVNFDVIPHHLTGGIGVSPDLIALLSPWLRIAGSPEQLVKDLKMQDFREEIKEKIWSGKWYGLNPNINPNWAGEPTIVVCTEKRFLNKTIAQVAKELKADPLDALMAILIADPYTKIARLSGEEWVKLEFYKHPEMMIGVDTFAVDETREGRHIPKSLPNENSFGGFPRYIRRAVRETKTLSIEEAIRKITSLPAKKFKLEDRGVLRPEAYADIVVMNAETITDRGDQVEPRRYPQGIEHVIINGTVVVRNSKHTGALPGKILYREQN